jgi:hypothetical protein
MHSIKERKMSEGLQLSKDMIDGIVKAIGEHDANAQQDMMIVVQYLAAIAGFFAAEFPGPDAEREEFLKYLNDLMQHVCNDRRKQNQQPAQQPAAAPMAGKSVPTDDPAVGIWKPE